MKADRSGTFSEFFHDLRRVASIALFTANVPSVLKNVCNDRGALIASWSGYRTLALRCYDFRQMLVRMRPTILAILFSRPILIAMAIMSRLYELELEVAIRAVREAARLCRAVGAEISIGSAGQERQEPGHGGRLRQSGTDLPCAFRGVSG